MAVSEVGICNSALRKIGATPIVALDDGSKAANACADLYEKLRDDLLRGHPWNFAVARALLAVSDTAPVFGWDYRLALPVDCLRALSAHPDTTGRAETDHAIEGRYLVANTDVVYLRYVRQITDPNEMPPDFRELLALALAANLALPLADSNTMADQMAKAAERALLRAKSTDAMEGTPEAMPPSSWVTARQ